MKRNNKIILCVLVIIVASFLFPKKNGAWMINKDTDFHCKCVGYEHIYGSPLGSKDPGNSLCFGIPYSCGSAGLKYYFGK